MDHLVVCSIIFGLCSCVPLDPILSFSDRRRSLLLCCRLSLGCDETLFGLLPVDDAPDILEVLGPGILIVNVVGMLPDVDTDDGHNVGADICDWVLVGSSAVRESILSLVVDEPAPSRALDCSSACVEHLDESIDGTPAFDDGIVEGASLRHCTISLSAERIPEKLVVQVASSVKLDQI